MLQVVPQPPIDIAGNVYGDVTHLSINGVMVPRQQLEALARKGEPLLLMTRTEVAEFGALCVMNRKRKMTAQEALTEYLEFHPEVAARNGVA